MPKYKTCEICKQAIKNHPIEVSDGYVCNAQCLKKYKTISKKRERELRWSRYY